MSTTLYLECRSHKPPISSWSEVGHNLTDLPRIRREIANRDKYVAAAELEPDYDDPLTNTAATFFTQHPNCNIGICDEYGNQHPVC